MTGKVVGTIKWTGPTEVTEAESQSEKLWRQKVTDVFASVIVVEITCLLFGLLAVLGLVFGWPFYFLMWLFKNPKGQLQVTFKELIDYPKPLLYFLFWGGPVFMIHPLKSIDNL